MGQLLDARPPAGGESGAMPLDPGPPLRPALSSARLAAGGVAAVVCLAGLVACVPPARTAPGPGGDLLVANSLEDTVHRLDPVTGQARGAPLPVPGSPRQLAPAPAGSALVLSQAPDRGCRLTHLVPPDAPGRAWAARPLLALPAPETCTHALLAGDGRRYAVVGIPVALEVPGPGGPQPATAPPAPACRLLVLDLTAPGGPTGRPAREVAPCPPGAALTALAASDGPEGPLLHVGLWRGPGPGRPGGQGEVLALDPATGAVLARAELAGAPERLVAAPAPGRAGRRLYAVEGSPGPGERNPGLVAGPPTRWRLLALEPVALTVTPVAPLDADGEDGPPPVAVAPDGARVVVLLRAAGRRTALIPLDAATGATGRAVSLPGEALGGLVLSAERVYVPDVLGHGVWVVDHRQGRLLDKVPAGRGPLAITRSPPS
jgi:DNA-binding beta-propeller fold protein YncE